MSDTPVEGQGSPDAPEPVTPDLMSQFTEQELLDLAIEVIQARAPEWTPRAGSNEVVFLEALVTLLTSLNFTISQVPVQVVEHLLRMYGVTRDPGGPARAVARFDVSGSQSIYVVPAGTTVRASLEPTGESVDFVTDGRLEIETATGFGRVAVTAQEPGDEFNGIPAGQNLDLVDALTFVERVTLDTATSGGRGAESDASFQGRASAVLSRQVSTLVLPQHFLSAALERAEVGRARVLDLYDPTATDGGGPGSHVGHVTVVVADRDGVSLSEGERDQIREWLEDQALASLVIHVEDPDFTDVDVTVTVRATGVHPYGMADDVKASLSAEVEWHLRRWLSPAQWQWGGEVSQFALVAQVASVPGVAEVLSVSDGVTLDGVAPLPRLGDVDVTVEVVDE